MVELNIPFTVSIQRGQTIFFMWMAGMDFFLKLEIFEIPHHFFIKKIFLAWILEEGTAKKNMFVLLFYATKKQAQILLHKCLTIIVGQDRALRILPVEEFSKGPACRAGIVHRMGNRRSADCYMLLLLPNLVVNWRTFYCSNHSDSNIWRHLMWHWDAMIKQREGNKKNTYKFYSISAW